MKPPRFAYHDPASLNDALALLAEHGEEAKVLAGGQSLVPMMNLRLARPSVVVDLNQVQELDYIQLEKGEVVIGALARQRAVERAPEVLALQPLIPAAIRLIGHPQVRNRGTVVGSLAHADPAAELPAVAVALDAEMSLVGPNGRRDVSADDFFISYFTTALAPDEMLVEARFPTLPARTGWAISEVARRHGDFALAGAVATLTLDEAGNTAEARLALFGVSDRPVRLSAAEQALQGQAPDAESFAQAAEVAQSSLTGLTDDVHASADYRRHVAGVLLQRALGEALDRAHAASA